MYAASGEARKDTSAATSSVRRSGETGSPRRARPEGCHYSGRALRGGSVVLVDEPAEFVAAPDLASGRSWWRRVGVWRLQGECPVRALGVVVVDVDAEHAFEVSAVEDQQPVEALCTHGTLLDHPAVLEAVSYELAPDRILTTHVGSLTRPEPVVDGLAAPEEIATVVLFLASAHIAGPLGLSHRTLLGA